MTFKTSKLTSVTYFAESDFNEFSLPEVGHVRPQGETLEKEFEYTESEYDLKFDLFYLLLKVKSRCISTSGSRSRGTSM